MNSSDVLVLSSPPSSLVVSSDTDIMSPMIAWRRLVLPELVSPITHTNSPYLMDKSMFLRVILDLSVLSSIFSFSSTLSSFFFSSSSSESSLSCLLMKPQEKLPFTSRAFLPHEDSSYLINPSWTSSSIWYFCKRRIDLAAFLISFMKWGIMWSGH